MSLELDTEWFLCYPQEILVFDSDDLKAVDLSTDSRDSEKILGDPTEWVNKCPDV